MKKITLIFTLLLALSFKGYAQFPSPYCGPLTFNFDVEAITLVHFTTINNTSAPDSQVDHEDFTAIMGSVDRGNSYPITLKGFTGGSYTNYFVVYFDWNQDGDFLDDSEMYQIGLINSSTGVDDKILTGTIEVPATALEGVTRMRVVKSFGSYSNSCLTASAGYGQVEDYSVTVVVPQCVAPNSGVANVTSATTATLSWTSPVSTSFVVVQPAGTAAPSTAAGTGQAASSSFSATNLSPVTAYQFYVRNMCSEGVYSSWAGPYTFNTTQIPTCVTNPTPTDGMSNVPVGPITLSWTASTTGDPATSYDVYVGETADDVNTLVLTTTETNTADELVVNAFGTTIFWRVAPSNIAGANDDCTVWSFNTETPPGYCLNAEYGQFPGSAAGYTPSNCDGVTPNYATQYGYASEFSLINVTAGQTYVFSSSVATDFITISNAAGTSSIIAATTPVTWVSDVDGQVRFYTHTSDQCGSEDEIRSRGILCGIPSGDEPDFANLQGPATAAITQGDSQVIYGRVFEAGLTDVAPNIEGQAPGIGAWVGVSTTNTNPNTWINWTVATHNPAFVGPNDEYMASIGANFQPGTYYYATRYKLNNGVFVYGGYNGGFWNGTTNVSGVLTVSAPPTPDNDVCASATTLIVDEDFCDGTNTNGTNLGATNSGVAAPSCFGSGNLDVWYSFTASADMTQATISTDFTGGTLVDTQIALYSGTCGSLVEIECDQDSGTTILSNGYSYNSIIENVEVNPNETYFVRVSGYSNSGAGTFCLNVTGVHLSTDNFNASKIAVYPNPVKSMLTIENSETISSAAVYNLVGQLVVEKQIDSTLGQLDLSALSSGTYIVKITSNEQTKTIKVIKE